MRIMLDEHREVQIGVKHEEKKLDPKKPKSIRRTTTIRVTLRNNGQEVLTTTGTCVCRPTEQFVKTNGRRQAMRRALDQMGEYSRQDRQKIYRTLLPKLAIRQEKREKKKVAKVAAT